MEEDAVLSAGLGVMDQLIRGEYDEVYEELRSDVRDATTASALEDVMDTATDGLGEPKEVTDTMVTGVTDTDEPHAIAVIRRKYEKKSVYFRIAFDPDMQLIGSGNLLQSLQAAALIDEYNIWIFPLVLGRGKRLFGEAARPAALRLVRTRVSASGVVMSTYVPDMYRIFSYNQLK